MSKSHSTSLIQKTTNATLYTENYKSTTFGNRKNAQITTKGNFRVAISDESLYENMSTLTWKYRVITPNAALH